MASALCKGSSGVDVSKGGCCVMELYTSLIKTTKLLVLFLTINASVIQKCEITGSACMVNIRFIRLVT